MIRKKINFYVKKMQKSVMILFGVLGIAAVLSGCTKKEDAGLILLSMEEEGQSGLESLAGEDALQQDKRAEQPAQQQEQRHPEQSENVQEQKAFLYVHICGAVEVPGVYELPAGSRVFEAVVKAGGFTEDAAADYVNQAQIVPDAAKIVIPTLEEVEALLSDEAEGSQYGILQEPLAGQSGQEAAGDKTGTAAGNVSGRVNLNTAGKTELCTLPGIGEAKADAILKYRAQIGCFTSKEQIMEISGIKEALYMQLQDQICVN